MEVKNLTKKLGGRNVVDDLSLTVQRGEIYGFLGPNGAGKTTTIRMIVGLITKTNGQVLVNGIDADKEYSNAMTQIGAIVENPEMYKFLTGHQNLIHFARMAKEKITNERIDEVVKLVDLEDAIHKKVKTYSLGMRQRLGVAQAILHRPSLLILDEPTNGLDPQGIHEFRAYLRKLTKEGTSVIVSSHLLSEMQLMCDRVAIIQKGKLINVSSVHEMSESESEQTSVRFIVSNTVKAQDILQMKDPELEITRQSNELQLTLKHSDIPLINEILVNAGIAVYGIISKQQTLEEKFLELTKEGVTQ
ncbi:ABC transporter ATP-binding protein [Pseudalkalibacillus decolorationis]|uniref:ABC transporter ATP-binding protein n=1 Tax=Pseudalkalibacillus decolorationis TaxID=163879 RepID=UPI00214886AB|nr:ABC transporter ATP-binding protein [Pseudalkalibacillus decolorationis]